MLAFTDLLQQGIRIVGCLKTNNGDIRLHNKTFVFRSKDASLKGLRDSSILVGFVCSVVVRRMIRWGEPTSEVPPQLVACDSRIT